MVYEMFTRKRSPDCSSSEPPRKTQSRWSSGTGGGGGGGGSGGGGGDASHRTGMITVTGGIRSQENALRKLNYDYQADRSGGNERRPSSCAEARFNPFSRSSSPMLPSRQVEEDLEPPGTGTSTLQYTLTPRVSFLTWKDRLYRELEELNCLFTVEPTLKRKTNMTAEEELTYRNLAKAIICMRLDDAHLALVERLADPLKVMKVLADFREPELRHLEKRAHQRLDSAVYHAAVPVRDFLRTFENLLNEVEKYSGERQGDVVKKQHLLSAIVGEFPDILVGSKARSNEIRYEDLKKLLIEAVERRAASQKAELEQRRAATANVASHKVAVSEKQPAAKNVDAKAQSPAGRTAKVEEPRAAASNAALSQGSESRNVTGKVAVVNEQRSAGSTSSSSNVAASDAAAKEQHLVKDLRPAAKSTDTSQRPATVTALAGRNGQVSERHLVGASVSDRSCEKKDRRPIASSVVNERPPVVKDAKSTEQRSGTYSIVDERSMPARDSKATDRRSVAKADMDERPLPVRDASVNERGGVPPGIPTPLFTPQSVRTCTNATSRNAEVEDPRPVRTNAKVDEQQHATVRPASAGADAVGKIATTNERLAAGAAVAGKKCDVDERYAAPRSGAANDRCSADAIAASKSGALYERRPPKPSAAKDELEEQVELDKRIQEQIETNPRLVAQQISCTKCGAYGHVVGDCRRKDNRRKCYNCLKFVNDHVASTCPLWGEYSTATNSFQPRANSRFAQEPRESDSSPPPFAHSRFSADHHPFAQPPEMLEDDEEEEEEDDLPLVDGLRQVYHIRRRLTTKKLKTGRTARKDLIFTDSDFYMDVEYREMFIEEDEEEPGDIILETIKVMSTNRN